jgi:hypothetical protein
MQINLISTEWFNSPGMMKNYLHACKVNDKDFMSVYEATYSDHPNANEIFKALRDGNYTIEGNTVVVDTH